MNALRYLDAYWTCNDLSQGTIPKFFLDSLFDEDFNILKSLRSAQLLGMCTSNSCIRDSITDDTAKPPLGVAYPKTSDDPRGEYLKQSHPAWSSGIKLAQQTLNSRIAEAMLLVTVENTTCCILGALKPLPDNAWL